MAEPQTTSGLYAECLAAMAVFGNVYPCDTLAPALHAERALPSVPAAPPPQDRHTSALFCRAERT